jgi:hypothetical protein
MVVKIRYKTDAKPNDVLQWRVIIDEVEYNASNVIINCMSHTTRDYIDGIGEKWHISCKATQVIWMGEECIII